MPVDKDNRIILNGPNNTIDPSTGGVNYSKDDNFTYHVEESKRCQELRTLAKKVAESTDALIAQIKIQEAMMCADSGNPFTGKIGELDDIDRKKLAERMKGAQDACK